MSASQHFIDMVRLHGGENAVTLGPYASSIWRKDPKCFFFLLARYKFCSKVLAGKQSVLEVGCGDGAGIPLLLQTVEQVRAIDVNAAVIKHNQHGNPYPEKVQYEARNIIAEPFQGVFDAAYSLDVIEHLEPAQERMFLANIAQSLKKDAPCIIGTPNITSSAYAGEDNRREHINLKDHTSLVAALGEHFVNVFLFSMNDEVVHTGFYPMAQYLMALAVGPRHASRA